MSGKYIEFTMDCRSVMVTVMQGREMLVKGRVFGLTSNSESGRKVHSITEC